MLEKARQAERLATERAAAQDRYERFRQAVEVNDQVALLAATHPSPNPLPVLRAGVERLRALDQKARELRAALAGEVPVTFEVAAEPSWRPLSRWGVALTIIGLVIVGGSFVARSPRHRGAGPVPTVIGGVIAGIGLVLAAVALWMRRSYHMGTELRDTEIDRRLRGRSEIEAELAASRPTSRSVSRARACRHRDGRGPARARGGARRPDRRARRAARGARRQATARDARPDRGTRRPWRSSRGTARSRPSGRSPRSRGPASAWRSRSATRRPRSSGARDDEANARARVEANAVDAEEVAGHAERLAGWREQLAALQRRQRVSRHDAARRSRRPSRRR